MAGVPPNPLTSSRQFAFAAGPTWWLIHLGVAPDVLQQRLAGWGPAPLRGEIRRDDGRLLYLDCYNANPASMADALATFEAVAPTSEPRLYVLGGMEELGEQSAALHRACTDHRLRAVLTTAGRRRAAELSDNAVARRITDVVAAVVGRA